MKEERGNRRKGRKGEVGLREETTYIEHKCLTQGFVYNRHKKDPGKQKTYYGYFIIDAQNKNK